MNRLHALAGLAALALLAGAASAGASPRTDYMLKCMGCHGPDGAAVVGKVPALKDSVAQFLSVDGGRAYLVQVPGSRQSPLSDTAVADLLNWLLPHFDAAHMPADFQPFTGEEVTGLRAHRIPNVKTERARLIDEIDALPAAQSTP